MGTRTVRLDDEMEKVLHEICRTTGLSISNVLQRGILAFYKEVSERATKTPFGVYRDLDLGPGGYAIAPSTDVRRAVGEALERKRRR